MRTKLALELTRAGRTSETGGQLVTAIAKERTGQRHECREVGRGRRRRGGAESEVTDLHDVGDTAAFADDHVREREIAVREPALMSLVKRGAQLLQDRDH